MIPIGLFSQLMIIVLSVLIIFTYVKPSLTEMKSTQDTIATYEQEQTKVADVNEKLSRHTSAVENISDEDTRRLLSYMPNEVDTIAVPRDIKAMTDEVGVILKDIKYQGASKPPIGEAVADQQITLPKAHIFNLMVEGSYSQLKQLFTRFEQNAYPLEVRELTITKQEGGFLQATMQLQTYNRLLPPDQADVAQQ